MAKRRPYAVMIYKGGRRHFYGFATRGEATGFRRRHSRALGAAHVSPVIDLGGRRGSR